MTPLEAAPANGDGSTELSPEDFEELIPDWVTTRADLNAAESESILSARIRYFSRSIQSDKILDDLFLRKLHKDMFAPVWTWAGTYRKRELNLGVEYFQIAPSVRSLLESVAHRISIGHDLNLLTCELHHKLVSIHPFVNGNGRHGRLFVDLLRRSLGLQPFSWGGMEAHPLSESRATYLRALRQADRGNMSPLLSFVQG